MSPESCLWLNFVLCGQRSETPHNLCVVQWEEWDSSSLLLFYCGFKGLCACSGLCYCCLWIVLSYSQAGEFGSAERCCEDCACMRIWAKVLAWEQDSNNIARRSTLALGSTEHCYFPSCRGLCMLWIGEGLPTCTSVSHSTPRKRSEGSQYTAIMLLILVCT